MRSYNTNQKKLIVDFLKNNAEKQYTIEELAENITSSPTEVFEGDEAEQSSQSAPKIGKSTIYRLINKMVEEGSVRRTVKGNSRQFLYQYADIEECKFHLHMKCRECGKLFHMDDEKSKKLMDMLHDGNGFDLDMRETLLMGTCEKCHIDG